jgi:hypothetical protein
LFLPVEKSLIFGKPVTKNKIRMKKVMLALILAGGLVSCSKEYTCTCEYYTNGNLENTDNTKIAEGDKDKSAQKCDEMDSDYTTQVGGNTVHTQTKCTLQ